MGAFLSPVGAAAGAEGSRILGDTFGEAFAGIVGIGAGLLADALVETVAPTYEKWLAPYLLPEAAASDRLAGLRPCP